MLIQLGHLVQELGDELESPMQSEQIASAVFGGLKKILFSFVVDHRVQITVVFSHLLILPVVLEYHKFTVHIGGDKRKDFAQIVEEAVEEKESQYEFILNFKSRVP